MQTMEHQIDVHTWRQAAQHHAGHGLENGADSTLPRKHIKYLRGKDLHKEAGLLQSICAGGMWSRARRYSAGLVKANKCTLCGAGSADDHYWIWDCQPILRSKAPIIIKTRWIRSNAIRGRYKVPCLYLRGIVPTEWIHRKPIEEIEVHCVNDRDPFTNFRKNQAVYIDGSGGNASNGPESDHADPHGYNY